MYVYNYIIFFKRHLLRDIKQGNLFIEEKGFTRNLKVNEIRHRCVNITPHTHTHTHTHTHQWRNARRLNIAENCSETRTNSSWIAVVFPMKVPAILYPEKERKAD